MYQAATLFDDCLEQQAEICLNGATALRIASKALNPRGRDLSLEIAERYMLTAAKLADLRIEVALCPIVRAS